MHDNYHNREDLPQSVSTKIANVLLRVKSDLKAERITNTSTWADLHLDSLDLVAALVELENEFGLQPDSIDWAEVTTFGKLIEFLQNGGGKSQVDLPLKIISTNGKSAPNGEIAEFAEHLRGGTALSYLDKLQFSDVRDKAALYAAVREWMETRGTNLYRVSLTGGSARQAEVVLSDGAARPDTIVFSANHYLGLHRHPAVIEAANRATVSHGAGCGTSSASGGYTDLHRKLERELCEFLEKPAGIVFPTGYTANLGAICALVGRGDRVVVDREIHASIFDGCRLSGAKIEPFRHNDPKDLDRVLARRHRGGTTLVIVESVYSMGGADADLPTLIEMAHRHDALMMVDESHGFGFYGERGAGLAEAQGVLSKVDVWMTTMSKSLGSVGGFIAGDADLIELIRGTSRALNFQACAPASSIAAALAALELICAGFGREKLWANTARLRRGVAAMNLPTMGTSPIVPIFAATANAARRGAQSLLKLGIYTPPIVYPAVPPDQSRLRLTVTASHTDADIDRALAALNAISLTLDDRDETLQSFVAANFNTHSLSNNGAQAKTQNLNQSRAEIIEAAANGKPIFQNTIAALAAELKLESAGQ